MNSNPKKWFNGYYIIIIILCLMIGLFIWFSFRAILSDLEQKKEDAYKKKATSSLNRVRRFSTSSASNKPIKTNKYEKDFLIPFTH
jgi:hypothetical protein